MEEGKRPWLPFPDPLGIAEKLTENTPIQLKDPIRKILKEGLRPSKGNPEAVTPEWVFRARGKPERVKRLRERGFIP